MAEFSLSPRAKKTNTIVLVAEMLMVCVTRGVHLEKNLGSNV